jgi:hypothetical protein
VTTIAIAQRNPYLERPQSSSLADVVDLILDKGLVIDAYVRVSLLGIEVLTIDARIVIASVDTYLRFAEAVNRLNLTQTQTHGLPELLEGGAAAGTKGKVKGAMDAVGEKVSELTRPEGKAERQNAERGQGQPEGS